MFQSALRINGPLNGARPGRLGRIAAVSIRLADQWPFELTHQAPTPWAGLEFQSALRINGPLNDGIQRQISLADEFQSALRINGPLNGEPGI